ncbi:MAG: hypothetical protein HON32_00500 [Francisellaceae bacterium]|nr:hypothetical protein [Francisellaceae bacterium]
MALGDGRVFRNIKEESLKALARFIAVNIKVDWAGNIEFLNFFIKSLPNDAPRNEFINKQSDNGATSLYMAFQNGKKDIVEYLLSIGADCTVCINGGWSIAHLACQNGNLEMLKTIIKSLSNDTVRNEFINKQSDDGSTPLYFACQHNKKDIAEYLLSIGGDYNVCQKGGWNLAHLACGNGKLAILKLIIKSLPDDVARSELVNKQSDNGTTPLHLACQYNKKDMAEYLLSIGADYKVCQKGGRNVAHLAGEQGNIEMLKLIIKNLPDDASRNELVNQHDQHGVTPLYLVFQIGNKDIAEYLLSIGADCKICIKGGWNLAHLACIKGKLAILKLIIESFTDDILRNEFINKQSDDGSTPLHFACQYNKKNITEYLLSVGADYSFQDDTGCGPMHVAASNGDLEMLKTLLVSSTDNAMRHRLINDRVAGGGTPLFIACQKGHLNIVKFLLSCREVSLQPLIRHNEDLVDFYSGNNRVVEKRMNVKLQNESGVIQYKDKTQISVLDIAAIMGHKEITIALNVYINKNPDKYRLQEKESQWERQLCKDFSIMMYSSRLHKKFQSAYESGQKEDRERSGYGEGAMTVYNLADTKVLRIKV